VTRNSEHPLRGPAHPILDSQEPLLATGCDANNYKGAELFILAPKATVERYAQKLVTLDQAAA